MAKISNDEIVQAWTKTLSWLDHDVLDRIIKRTAKYFEIDLRDPDMKEEIETALAAKRTAVKARYVMGFEPLLTDNGLVAFLIENASRWGIEIPAVSAGSAPEKPTRRERRAVASTRGANRAAAREAVDHKATGAVLEMHMPGDVVRLAEALGFRRVPAEDAETVMKKTSRLVVTAVPGKGLVVRFRESDIRSAARFARRRAGDNARLLNKAVILTRKGTVPELDERTVERVGLRQTSKGYRIQAAA